MLPVGANEPVRVEARIVAATNKDLRREMEEGRFREDLYFRLDVVSITIPPLRERRDDIPDLVEFLVAKHARELGKKVTGVAHETMQLLLACRWKGNVRELENALQRAVILGEGSLITPADLPPDLAPVASDPALVDELAEAVRRFERQHIERILRQTPDKKEAARRLGMGLSSLYRKIGELGLHWDPPYLRPFSTKRANDAVASLPSQESPDALAMESSSFRGAGPGIRSRAAVTR